MLDVAVRPLYLPTYLQQQEEEEEEAYYYYAQTLVSALVGSQENIEPA